MIVPFSKYIVVDHGTIIAHVDALGHAVAIATSKRDAYKPEHHKFVCIYSLKEEQWG